MNNDLISRATLVDILRAKADMATCTDARIAFDFVANIIDKIPAVDAEPVRHGRWDNNHRCTQCGSKGVIAYTPYNVIMYIEAVRCPNCGAIMDEDPKGAIK